jgi:hypothetical protein
VSDTPAELIGAAAARRRRRLPVSRAIFSLTDRNAFEAAVDLGLAWIGSTLGVDLPAAARERQSAEFGGESARGSASIVRMDDAHGAVWAVRVDFFGDRVPGRVWTTDLFVEQRRGSFARFGAQLSCEVDLGDRGFDHSRPRIIRNVLSRLAGKADGEPLSEQVVPVEPDQVEDLIALLYRPSRRLPIVLVSTDDEGRAQIDIEQLENRLSGTAHLRCIATEASRELTSLVGKRMSAFNGAVRAYMPGVERGAEDPFQHPLWLAPSSGWNPRLLGQLASRILPLGFRDTDGDVRFWRVGLLRQAASRVRADRTVGTREEKLEAELKALEDERDLLKDTALSAEALMEEANDQLNQSRADVERKAKENSKLRQAIQEISHSGGGDPKHLRPDDVYAVFEQTPSLETSLRVISSLFPNRIVVLDTALESARDSVSFKYPKKAFELLWTLCTSYWAALVAGEGDVSARQCLGNSYAAKEAESLSSGGKKRRTFSVDGTEILMLKHLKIGIKDSKSETLRVHFEWLANQKRLVIGHCGGHLDF